MKKVKKTTNQKIIWALALLIGFLFNCTVRVSAQIYSSQNINFLSNWYDSNVIAEPFYGIKYNGIWAWVDSNNREYAIIGATHGTYFVEVTNPVSPVLRDFVPGIQTSSIWREYKTYGNYVYMVSDASVPNGLQIADLSYLPDSVHVVHSSDTIIQRCHTIFIDGNKLYAGGPSGGVVGNIAGMAVFSLANPEAPQLLRKLSQDYPAISYVHDMFVKNDTVYASCAYQGLFILEFLSNNTFNQLASLTQYPDQGYNHSSALTPNGQTLIFCDEVPGNLAVKSLDVSDFNNLSINTTFKSNPGATAHNPYPYGNQFSIIAYYKDGLRIFDISNPASITPVGYFDTYWQNDSCVCYNETPFDYAGCWGAYPDLPSGNLLASDMQNGLFVLDASMVLGLTKPSEKNPVLTVFPNPVQGELNLQLNMHRTQVVTISLNEISGRQIWAEQVQFPFGKSNKQYNLTGLAGGIYMLTLKSSELNVFEKIVYLK